MDKQERDKLHEVVRHAVRCDGRLGRDASSITMPAKEAEYLLDMIERLEREIENCKCNRENEDDDPS